MIYLHYNFFHSLPPFNFLLFFYFIIRWCCACSAKACYIDDNLKTMQKHGAVIDIYFHEELHVVYALCASIFFSSKRLFLTILYKQIYRSSQDTIKSFFNIEDTSSDKGFRHKSQSRGFLRAKKHFFVNCITLVNKYKKTGFAMHLNQLIKDSTSDLCLLVTFNCAEPHMYVEM